MTLEWLIANTVPLKSPAPFDFGNRYHFYQLLDMSKFFPFKEGDSCDYDIRNSFLNEWDGVVWVSCWFNAWHWNYEAFQLFFASSVADYFKSLSYIQRRLVGEMEFFNA